MTSVLLRGGGSWSKADNCTDELLDSVKRVGVKNIKFGRHYLWMFPREGGQRMRARRKEGSAPSHDAVRGLPLSTSASRGEGVQKSADFADKQSYRVGKGSKNPKVLWTYLMEAP